MTTHTTVEDWAGILSEYGTLGEALGISPCMALEMAFPAIVGNGEIMEALAALLEPVMGAIAPVVVSGAVPHDAAEEFLHNLFHTVQVAAALGHMVGVDESTGATVEIPEDLSAVDWSSLPDVLGEDSQEDS